MSKQTRAVHTRGRRRQGPRQAEQSASTVARLIDTARALFAERGYRDTSVEDIVVAAGVTRGALYHHFASKTEIFEATFEREQRRLADRTRAAALGAAGGPWAGLEAGCVEFLDACLDPATRQILLVDGPGVLGLERMRELEAPHTKAQMREAIEAAIVASEIAPRPVEPMLEFLFGGMCEAALAVARPEPASQAHADTVAEVRRTFADWRLPH